MSSKLFLKEKDIYLRIYLLTLRFFNRPKSVKIIISFAYTGQIFIVKEINFIKFPEIVVAILFYISTW